MRITYQSLSRPRRAAKALTDLIAGMRLTEAQAVVARMSGDDDWKQLKVSAEAPGAQASPDDEDLSPAALHERREFQARQVQATLGNTLAQAREIVRRVSPTVRVPTREPIEPQSQRPMLRGSHVFMPSPFTRFAPSYPEVFGCFYDVDRVKVDFIQPDEYQPGGPHLASKVTFTFENGKTLALDGVYFWKFLDTAPREMLNAQGEFTHPNPYADEPVDGMVERLRKGYQCLFKTSPDGLPEPAPLWIELDLANARLTRRNPVGLQAATAEAFRAIFRRVVRDSTDALQPAVDAFMTTVLNGPRVELKLVAKGGRGSGLIGNEYVASSWDGTGHWTIQDLFLELSPEPLHPSGCGGNVRYRDLFDRALRPQFEAALLSACLEAVNSGELYADLHPQLELPALKGRVKAATRAQQVVDGLLATSLRLDLAAMFSNALAKAQGARTFSTWREDLSVDETLVRPRIKLDEVIEQHRRKA